MTDVRERIFNNVQITPSVRSRFAPVVVLARLCWPLSYWFLRVNNNVCVINALSAIFHLENALGVVGDLGPVVCTVNLCYGSASTLRGIIHTRTLSRAIIDNN